LLSSGVAFELETTTVRQHSTPPPEVGRVPTVFGRQYRSLDLVYIHKYFLLQISDMTVYCVGCQGAPLSSGAIFAYGTDSDRIPRTAGSILTVPGTQTDEEGYDQTVRGDFGQPGQHQRPFLRGV
jgi:hypothetical protein